MKIVLVSDSYNHHKASFSRKMWELLGGNFAYIEVMPLEQERVNLGFSHMTDPFVLYYAQDKELCDQWIDQADVMVYGFAPEKQLRRRLRKGKITIKYAERIYKIPPKWYEMPARAAKYYLERGRFQNCYLLCASAFTSQDYNRTKTFPNRMYKWGYFPETKHYHMERLFAQKNKRKILWMGSARNAGIDMARGKYLTFVDSDDTVDSTFFAGAISEISRSSADLYICGLTMETWKNGSVVRRENYHIDKSVCYSIREMFENCEVSYPIMCICGPYNKLYLRETIAKADLRFDESMSLGEDTYFNMNYFEQCGTVFFDDAVYYHYRRGNANSLSSKLHKDTYEIQIKVYEKMYQDMLLFQCSAEAMERFETMYVRFLIGCIHAFFRQKGQATHKEKIGLIKKISRNDRIESIEANCLDGTTKLLVRLLKRKKIVAVWCMFEIRYRFLF